MNTYKPETLVVVAQELVNQGGYKGNPLMDHPQVRQAVTEILDIIKEQSSLKSLETRQ